MKKIKNMHEYFECSTYGAALEVVEALIDEGHTKEEAEELVKEEIKTNADEYLNTEDFASTLHKEYGYPARLNQALNSIREMIQSDVIEVLKSGHREQIGALRTSLVEYIEIIDGMEEPTDSACEAQDEKTPLEVTEGK